jgi:hypothetical protein
VQKIDKDLLPEDVLALQAMVRELQSKLKFPICAARNIGNNPIERVSGCRLPAGAPRSFIAWC